MSDDELVAAFEDTTLDASLFTHEAHVRVAWWYVRQAGFAQALGRFGTALRRYATAKGAAAKYHETITVAWLAVVAERLDETPDLGWEDFAQAHPELLEKALLERYYDAATLQSDRARRVFLLPARTASRLEARDALTRPAGTQ